jgi:hypothetical protein
MASSQRVLPLELVPHFMLGIPTGAVYRGDLRTGEGDVLVDPQAGRSAIGLKFDDRTGLLFVAGGPTGSAYVYDGNTGANVAAIQLETLQSFINDVVVTKDAAYFTNSSQPILYKVPLENNGEVPAMPGHQDPLSGDYEFTAGQFNRQRYCCFAEWQVVDHRQYL